MFSLPDMKLLWEVDPPAQLTQSRGSQREVLSIAFSPDGAMLAILWFLVFPLWPGTDKNKNSHGSFGFTSKDQLISIFLAATGDCLGSEILPIPENDLSCTSPADLQWTPTSSHLIAINDGGIYQFDTCVNAG